MDALLRVLRAYQSFNPPGWVATHESLPLWAGIACGVVGLVLLLLGGGRLFRFLAGPLGALIGMAWTGVLLKKLGSPGLDPLLGTAVNVALLTLGFLLPEAIVFLGVGIPVGLLGGELAGASDFLLGFVPGLLLGGGAAVFFYRGVAAIVSSAVGAWLLVLGALATLKHLEAPVAVVTRQPWGVLIAAALLAVAGSVYQLAVRSSRAPSRLDFRQAEQRALGKRRGASHVDE